MLAAGDGGEVVPLGSDRPWAPAQPRALSGLVLPFPHLPVRQLY